MKTPFFRPMWARPPKTPEAAKPVTDRWDRIKAFATDPAQVFPGHGQIKPEPARDRVAQALGREAAGGAEHPKNAAACFAKEST